MLILLQVEPAREETIQPWLATAVHSVLWSVKDDPFFCFTASDELYTGEVPVPPRLLSQTLGTTVRQRVSAASKFSRRDHLNLNALVP